jgi:hypothetical protein
MPQSILWIASYPKSGNTWVRALLTNFLADAPDPLPLSALADHCLGDMAAFPYERVFGGDVSAVSTEDIYKRRAAAHEVLSRARPGTVLVKTHVALGAPWGTPTITPQATWGAIYVVRNPLDVILSYAAHYGCTIDDAIVFAERADHMIQRKPGQIDQLVGDWSNHVRGWTQAPGMNRLVVRYEDLLKDTPKAMRGVVRFLGLPVDKGRIKRAVAHASFKTLSRQEQKSGFSERSANAERFFRSGKAGGWRDAMTDAQIERVCDTHADVMRAFGYLDDAGKPLVQARAPAGAAA